MLLQLNTLIALALGMSSMKGVEKGNAPVSPVDTRDHIRREVASFLLSLALLNAYASLHPENEDLSFITLVLDCIQLVFIMVETLRGAYPNYGALGLSMITCALIGYQNNLFSF